MSHAIFQRPLERISYEICNVSRVPLPELMRYGVLPISRQKSEMDCLYRMPFR